MIHANHPGDGGKNNNKEKNPSPIEIKNKSRFIRSKRQIKYRERKYIVGNKNNFKTYP